MSANECATCGRPLGTPADALSADCGGDCWGCVLFVESHGSPDGWSPEARIWHAAGLRALRAHNARDEDAA